MALTIKAEGIYKTFRSGWLKRKVKTVLRGIDLQVEEGEIFGILGPNGQGRQLFYPFSPPCSSLIEERSRSLASFGYTVPNTWSFSLRMSRKASS